MRPKLRHFPLYALLQLVDKIHTFTMQMKAAYIRSSKMFRGQSLYVRICIYTGNKILMMETKMAPETSVIYIQQTRPMAEDFFGFSLRERFKS
jgi:hypothetical protein